MSKLVLAVARYRTLVFGGVLRMDDVLRDERTLATGGSRVIRILHSVAPYRTYLSGSELSIRGDVPATGKEAFGYPFGSEEEAIQAVEDIKALVAKVNSEEKKAQSGAHVTLSYLE